MLRVWQVEVCSEPCSLDSFLHNCGSAEPSRSLFCSDGVVLGWLTHILPQSDKDAYAWAKQAADMGLPKAEYAVGYFTEVGIGVERNQEEAMVWFRKAAEHGDKRAKEKLQGKPHDHGPERKKSSQESCAIM